MSGIGTLGEGPLHAALKEVLAEPGDQHEVTVGDFVIDLVRPGELVEIQTGSFGRMRKKLEALLPDYRIRLVYPLAGETHIVKINSVAERQIVSRRKSPLSRSVYHIFEELTSIPGVLLHPHFCLEVISVGVDEYRSLDARGRSWRRKGWSTLERRLVEIFDATRFHSRRDWLKLLPAELPEEFDTLGLADAAGIPRDLAQKLCYTYLHAGLIELVGKRVNARIYRVAGS